MEPGEINYRKKFAEKYNHLFYDAWRKSRFNPVEGAWNNFSKHVVCLECL